MQGAELAGCYNGVRGSPVSLWIATRKTDMPADSLFRTFADRNQQTREQWGAFASHRQRIARIVEQHVPPTAQALCVLGAGNCTDVDLPWLNSRFQDILLVDLDGEAVSGGVRAQLGDNSPGVRRLAGDVTNAYPILDDLIHGRSRIEERLDELRQRLARLPALAEAEERFDCVISACLLSQLLDALGMAVPQTDPRYLELMLAMRRQHIAAMLGLLAPGGTLILLTDFVSSQTCPDLAAVPDDQLAVYAEQQLGAGNFFTGLNPQAVSQALAQMLPAGCPAPQVLYPWKWDLGPRLYLVTAHVARVAGPHS